MIELVKLKEAKFCSQFQTIIYLSIDETKKLGGETKSGMFRMPCYCKLYVMTSWKLN